MPLIQRAITIVKAHFWLKKWRRMMIVSSSGGCWRRVRAPEPDLLAGLPDGVRGRVAARERFPNPGLPPTRVLLRFLKPLLFRIHPGLSGENPALKPWARGPAALPGSPSSHRLRRRARIVRKGPPEPEGRGVGPGREPPEPFHRRVTGRKQAVAR